MGDKGSNLRDARFAVAHIVADALATAGEKLRASASASKDKEELGLSLICQMAGKTALGALALYHEGMWYAGAALTRQLVEHHHLCAYFAEDKSRIEQWLDADERDLRRYFSPVKLREAGGFTRDDYAAHCTWGGHPNPRGGWLVAGDLTGSAENLLLIDMAQHLRLIYAAVAKCLGDAANEMPEMVKAYNYLLKWQAVDPYSNGLPEAEKVQPGGS
ncbi:hypothetical protein ABZ747_29325 [Kitasatospora cineracea]|uniref:hypothetical protein n=1 Tax=Kitasatospora cineracea TaxID=88074 RepID=UPI0033C0C67F